jgi:zinc transporter ZupT
MVNNGMKKTKILLYILTLGFITPIGIIVGLVLTLDAESSPDLTQSVAVGVLQVGAANGKQHYLYKSLAGTKLRSTVLIAPNL